MMLLASARGVLTAVLCGWGILGLATTALWAFSDTPPWRAAPRLMPDMEDPPSACCSAAAAPLPVVCAIAEELVTGCVALASAEGIARSISCRTFTSWAASGVKVEALGAKVATIATVAAIALAPRGESPLLFSARALLWRYEVS